ncbi:MAG: beta galactosidase jelly roll domain-containing protein, partial [Chloroflexota bacterium]|nr:beta galactosidase jelly roll domain-containing protein [Chloroflexota bacterium]
VWEARLDPQDAGLAEDWTDPQTPFDRRLRVPLAWQAADPELRQYTGALWYRTWFRLPTEWRSQELAVKFGGVDYAARVWLNGHAVGSHTGGYTPFELDLAPALNWDADNLLVLRAFDPAELDEVPHGKQGPPWYTPVSGPWQSVTLLARPTQRIARLRCTPSATAGSVRVWVECRLADTPSAGDVQISVLEPGNQQPVARASVAVSAASPSAEVELHIPQPRLWSPDTPALYTIRAALASQAHPLDVLEERIGLRSFEAREGGLFLNGQPFWMRGALDQGYWPDTLYTPPSDVAIEREIRLAKQMGLNLLRKHIKPEDPRYLDACDRLGMLVWAEPANPSVFTPAAREALRRDLLEMVDRDFNRPSVVIWSLYNEDWGLPNLWSDQACQAWLRELYAEVKAIDPTRPICDNSGWAHVLSDLNDYHEYYSLPERAQQFRERLEFIAERPDDNYAQGSAPRGGEPILVSEWGNWAISNPRLARQHEPDGSEPAWFVRDRGSASANDGEQIETIVGVDERFRRLRLDSVFDSFDHLTQHVHTRAFRSLKAHIQEMRRRPHLRGWVVTEFSDIEWEANGWLDYWRQPKAFTADLADLNADISLIAIPRRPNVWSGDEIAVPVWVSNLTADPIAAVVRWQLEGTPLAGELPASVGAFETAPNAKAIRFVAAVDRPTNARLLLELRKNDNVLARTSAELALAPVGDGLVHAIATNAHGVDRVFRQRLERQGYLVPRGFRDDLDLAITAVFDTRVKTFVERGGRAVWLVSAEHPQADLAGLRFRGLASGESWHMAAGSAWARVARLAPAPVLPTLGWEMSDCFPRLAIDSGCLQADDEQLAGWFEGWLAKAGVFALRRHLGEGQLLITTFRLADRYGQDPVATLLLNRLVSIVLED